MRTILVVMAAALLAGCGGGETAAHDGTTSSSSGAGGAGATSSASIATTGAGGGDTAAATTSAGQGGAGGSIQPPECVLPDDCPGVDNDCRTRTCIDGKCGVDLVPAGTPLAQQTPGDCATATCDGAGHVTSIDDPSDVADDGTSCTVDACPGPTHTPVADGTACADGGGALCQGGACVEWIQVKCQADQGGTIFYGCDGTTSLLGDISFMWNGAYTVCHGQPDDPHAYCAPGTPCTLYPKGGGFKSGHCI